MHSPAVVVRQDDTVAHLCDLMQQAHVNGAPVVDDAGEVVGIVTEEDILYGSMGTPPERGMRQRKLPARSWCGTS